MQYIGVGVCALFVFCVHVQFTICKSKECENGECCSGYKWDATAERCVECDVGYRGPDCSLTCPVPFFGPGCNSMCKCSNESCHFSNGCAKLNESTGTVRKDKPQGGEVTHRSTPVIHPTTEKKRGTRQEDVRPQNENLGSVLRTSIFLVTGVFSVVLICYLITYSRYSKLLCPKSFSTTADMHALKILEINQEED
ncbi:uncharacterized protein LOC125677567 [Ostrea edulis]|uniref:uncharacterized protein LOC125677567 n=1 Tax=Ostrea edulis TaxID=37623 RepID=UPI0024AFFB27|nr:uncharacterized protein LOC125677567 [Ostrea edulis]